MMMENGHRKRVTRNDDASYWERNDSLNLASSQSKGKERERERVTFNVIGGKKLTDDGQNFTVSAVAGASSLTLGNSSLL